MIHGCNVAISVFCSYWIQDFLDRYMQLACHHQSPKKYYNLWNIADCIVLLPYDWEIHLLKSGRSVVSCLIYFFSIWAQKNLDCLRNLSRTSTFEFLEKTLHLYNFHPPNTTTIIWSHWILSPTCRVFPSRSITITLRGSTIE